MVDAFVGAVAVILILVLVVSPSQDRDDRQARAGIVVACGADNQSVLIRDLNSDADTSSPLRVDDLERLSAALSAYARPGDLSLRIILEGTAEKIRCLARVRSVLELSNQDVPRFVASETQPSALPGSNDNAPVFVIDQQLVAASDLPAAEGRQ